MGSDISSSQRYDAMSQCLHWLMAFLLIGMLVMGLTFDTIPEDWRKSAVTTHKATGVLLLGLVGVRVLWRFFRPAPPLLPASWFQRAMATLTHLTLYGLMVLIPLCGLMMIWGRGRAVDFFGLVEIPALIPENELGPIFYGWHVTGAYISIGLIGMHVLAVGYHWLIKKDTTLQRMTE